jgi:hypothetical protein
MTAEEALARARARFLRDDHLYGCAETTLITLQEAYGLPDAADSSPAMALNGGLAWRGGPCGAILGPAIAVGRLAGLRIADHAQAKRVARAIVDRYIDQVERIHGHVECRHILGLDIHSPEGHAAFIESGVWRRVCLRRVEFAVQALLPLRDEQVWAQTLRELEV